MFDYPGALTRSCDSHCLYNASHSSCSNNHTHNSCNRTYSSLAVNPTFGSVTSFPNSTKFDMKTYIDKQKKKAHNSDPNSFPSPDKYSKLDTWTSESKRNSRFIPPQPQRKFFSDLPKPNNVSSPEIGIKNASDNNSRDLEWIGPGTYDVNEYENIFQPKYTFSIGKSQAHSSSTDLKSSKITPGPGSYDIMTSSSKLRHEIRGNIDKEIPEEDDEDEPAPTLLGPTPWAYAYSETSQAFKSRTERFKSPKHDKTPGPADYFIQEPTKVTARSTIPTSRKSSNYSSAFISSRSSRIFMSNCSSLASSRCSIASNASQFDQTQQQDSSLNTQRTMAQEPNAFSVITKSTQRERKINLDSPANDTFWMVEEIEAKEKRRKLVQRMKNVQNIL